jgi:very-short-patch-repair endonuclease
MKVSDQEAKLTKEQEDYLKETLIRAQDFEELIRSRGWEHIKNYYQNAVQKFATNILLQEEKSIVEFEGERHELIGLRKLIGMIDSDIETSRKENEKNKNKN